MLRARSDQRERAFSLPRPETTCLSEVEEEEVAEALIAVAEAAASTVAAVATTTSEGAAAEVAVAAAISEAAAEEGLDEGAVVEALINSRIKDLQNGSSVSCLQGLIAFAVGGESGGVYVTSKFDGSLRKGTPT